MFSNETRNSIFFNYHCYILAWFGYFCVFFSGGGGCNFSNHHFTFYFSFLFFFGARGWGVGGGG